ncbi:60S ribosomal protein L33A [Linnemannia schmuckeri]|uniref:60S ribosomal protein L33A n=3 Tax=Linnemannia TaxID=2779861 RepID=A0A9P5S514_9FUNG|nr:60S ribosomal protein L33A [Linnemannia schmuckeri]
MNLYQLFTQDRSYTANNFQEPFNSPSTTFTRDPIANISPTYLFHFAFSLYAKGRVLGFKRAKRNQRPDISLVQIEGVKTAADTEFYLGKRVAFVYRAKREVNGSKIRCIWGRITRAHGGSGAVKARFRNNLPAKSFGASVRVMMYPSRV